jgi:hypothetical protein
LTKKIRIAALIAACLTPDIQTARSADLPLKARKAHELVTHRSRQSQIDLITKEILFQEFLEWLKKRDQVILRSSFIR